LTDPRYFGPLRGLPLDQIGRKDVATRLNRITLESGSIVAARARSQISALFAWALTQGLCEVNAVVGTLAPKAGQPRERVLSDAELAAIWRAAGDDYYGRIVRLLILVAARRSEVGGMAWSEIDLERGVWVLPAPRSKNNRAHTLPIMPMMRAIIEAVPRMASRDQLFGQRSGGFVSWSRGKMGLDESSGVQNWALHDLRRTAATKMADLGIAPHIIEEILNHQSGHRAGPAGIYNRSRYEREVKAALATWHDHLRTLTEGGERVIVPLVPLVAS
jgi:integrase